MILLTQKIVINTREKKKDNKTFENDSSLGTRKQELWAM